MNAYTAISPTEAANREAARRARNQTEAHAVQQAAAALSAALERSGGLYNTNAQHRLLDLCNAMLELADGDVEGTRDNTAFDLNCDKRGNPIDAAGVDEDEEAPWSDADKQRVFGGYR